MRKGWEIKKLGDVCNFLRGLTYSKKDEVDFSANIVLRSTNVDLLKNKLDFTELKYINDKIKIPENKKVSKGSLIICTANGSKSHLGKVALIDDDYNYAFGGFMGLLKPKKEIKSEFLFYSMISDSYKQFISELSDGININNLRFDDLAQYTIPIPPLPEQEQIVSILDETFVGIDQAKVNVERNLQNARELFQSELNNVFTNKGEEWVEKKLGECFKLKSGDGLISKNMKEGSFPVFGGNGIAGMHNNYNLSGSNVIIGRVGALCGNVRHITEKIWLTDNAFKIVDYNYEFDYPFLTYLLNFKDLRTYARQAAQPVISNSSLKDMMLQFPINIQIQKKIVKQLDTLSTETKKLEESYQKKLNSLEELKKSILNKAFKGELNQ